MKKNTKQTKDDKMKKAKAASKAKGISNGTASKDIGDIVANYHHYGYCNDCHCLQCFGERHHEIFHRACCEHQQKIKEIRSRRG